MTLILLLLVILFCLGNLAFGACAAGFFGIGPFRHSAIVRFVSDPVITPPAFLNALPLGRRFSALAAPDEPAAPPSA